MQFERIMKEGAMSGNHLVQLVQSKKERVLFGLLTCLALLSMALQAQANDMPMGKWWHLPKLAAALKLTSDEKQALDNLYARNHGTMSALTSSLKKEHLKLEVILEENPVDQTALDNQSTQVESVKQNLDNAHLQYILGVRNVLGPERFKQFSNKPREVRKKRRHKAGHGDWSKRSNWNQ
jgi:Spy/CpxP family protein refolding chaperone